MSARSEYVQSMRERYRQAPTRAAKAALLDEITLVTGYHRKHAIRCMRAAATKPAARARRGRARQYHACLSAIERLWEVLDYCCAERLHPQLLPLARDLVRHGELQAPREVLDELARISRATLARRLAELPRPKPRRRPAPPHPQRLTSLIPIDRYAWNETRSGALEIDLVEHNGGSTQGHYAVTLSVVDIVSGWSRRRALLGKSQAAVHEALERLLRDWPSAVWALHSDNGSEFLNGHLRRYCQQHHLEHHRSRPYRKNDNAHVEQKNRQLVREVIGYARYDHASDVAWLNRIYQHLDPYANLFLPSLKLMSKTRHGSKTSKRYDTARTPLERLTQANALLPERQQQLQQQRANTNPLKLRRHLDALLQRRASTSNELPTAAD